MTDVAVETALREFFARDPRGCAAVYLFGSRARDDYREQSDVDLGMLFEKTPPRTLGAVPAELRRELETLLGLPVDIVVLNHASPELRHHVLRDDRLILDHNRSVRIDFEVATRNEYWDVLPILRRYRKQAS